MAVAWPEQTMVTKNQVIILKIPTAAGEMMEEVSRISGLGKEGESITAINYFGPIAYAGTCCKFVIVACAMRRCTICEFANHPLFSFSTQ